MLLAFFEDVEVIGGVPGGVDGKRGKSEDRGASESGSDMVRVTFSFSLKTGLYNYQKLADGIHDPKVMDGVDYVSDTYPFTSARIWIIENDLLNVCLNQGFDACCVRINGGWNGYDDRLRYYRICQNEMR